MIKDNEIKTEFADGLGQVIRGKKAQNKKK